MHEVITLVALVVGGMIVGWMVHEIFLYYINKTPNEVITADVKFSPALLCILEDLQHLEDWKEVVEYTTAPYNREEERWTSPKGFIITDVWTGYGNYIHMTSGLTEEERETVKDAYRKARSSFKYKQQRDNLNKLLGVTE